MDAWSLYFSKFCMTLAEHQDMLGFMMQYKSFDSWRQLENVTSNKQFISHAYSINDNQLILFVRNEDGTGSICKYHQNSGCTKIQTLAKAVAVSLRFKYVELCTFSKSDQLAYFPDDEGNLWQFNTKTNVLVKCLQQHGELKHIFNIASQQGAGKAFLFCMDSNLHILWSENHSKTGPTQYLIFDGEKRELYRPNNSNSLLQTVCNEKFLSFSMPNIYIEEFKTILAFSRKYCFKYKSAVKLSKCCKMYAYRGAMTRDQNYWIIAKPVADVLTFEVHDIMTHTHYYSVFKVQWEHVATTGFSNSNIKVGITRNTVKENKLINGVGQRICDHNDILLGSDICGFIS